MRKLISVAINRLNLEPGDIAAVKGHGLLARLSRAVFSPDTDRYHHFLIWKKCTDGEDYIILESVAKGLAVGRLSMYEDQDIRFYRAVNLDRDTRNQACEELTRSGRAPYDWMVYFNLPWEAAKAEARILLGGRLPRKLTAAEVNCCEDSWLICTEAVALAYKLANWSLVPDGIMALPSAIEQARLDGVIQEIPEYELYGGSI